MDKCRAARLEPRRRVRSRRVRLARTAHHHNRANRARARSAAHRPDALSRIVTTLLDCGCSERKQQPHIRSRGEELAEKIRDPSWRARRWVVEACHSWLNRNRGILIRWSKKPENHLALLMLASGLIAFKKAHAATTQTR